MARMKSARQPRLTVEMAGGFANQLFQWGVAESIACDTAAEILWDERMVSRPGARRNQISAIGLASNVRSTSRMSEFAWKVTSEVSPRRVFPHLSQALRAGRLDRSVTDSESARVLLSQGRDVRLRGYAQEVGTLIPRRTYLRERLALALEGRRGVQQPRGAYSAVHVRRGDYVADQSIAARFGPPSVDYYLAAMRRMPGPILIVSDDASWCRTVLCPLEERAEVHESGSLHDDFAVLLGASELTVSNSTFSWWAAFAGHAGRVIAPSPWLDDPESPDLALDGWLRLDKRSGQLVG